MMDLKNVSIKTWLRTIGMIASLVGFIGCNVVSGPTWVEAVVTVCGIICTTIGFWQNNSFTLEAQTADKFMEYAKMFGVEEAANNVNAITNRVD